MTRRAGAWGVGVSTPLAAQDGTIIAKLSPKEDSDCRSFWEQRASAQIRSRQEGEEELEPAFQVSPKAIFAAPCQVEFDRMSAGPPRLETQQCGRFEKSPGLGMFPFAACPDICPSHEAIKQQNSVSLQDIDARYIDIYLYSKEARSPRLLFCWRFP